ncbi:MAG TPA: carbohydrate ABC transporter permease, partial [Rhodobacteraceae bacterium]|nr:carbohydrate ABC transporter permease [Paracoccaceae bacterium]
MQRIRHNRLNLALAHLALITYTIIALFPLLVILINSFKTRKAIFREPLALPTPDTFSLVG